MAKSVQPAPIAVDRLQESSGCVIVLTNWADSPPETIQKVVYESHGATLFKGWAKQYGFVYGDKFTLGTWKGLLLRKKREPSNIDTSSKYF